MAELVDELRSALPAAFESESYRARIDEFEEALREKQSSAFDTLREEGNEQRGLP